MYVIFLFSFTTLKAVKISKNTKFTHIKFSIKLCSYHGGPPYSPVNPANEKTYEFLSKYLNDLSKVFESDYWHLGGDEVSIGKTLIVFPLIFLNLKLYRMCKQLKRNKWFP